MFKFLRRLFTRKVLVRLAFIVLVLATLLLVFITEENWRGRRAWAAYRGAAEARGEQLFMKDFIPADIPDAENYAAIPLLRGVFERTNEGNALVTSFSLPNDNLPNRPKGQMFAAVSDERPTDLAWWQEYFVWGKLVKEKSGNAARDVLDGLGKYEPALQQLRDASSRPRCKFPTNWQDGFSTALPHMTVLQGAARLFVLRMDALLALGDSAAAYAEFRHVLRIHDALITEPSLISGLVRISALRIMASGVRDGLAAGRWTDAELRAIEKDLAGVNMLAGFQYAIATERGSFNEEMQRLVAAGTERKAELFALSKFIDGSERTKPVPDVVWSIYPDGWFYLNMVKASEYFDQVLAPFRLGADGNPVVVIREDKSAMESLESTHALSGPKGLCYLWIGIFLPAIGSAQNAFLAGHTIVQQTRLGCALERFRRAKGAFPTELAALVPEFIPAVPVDVCDGMPLRYRRNADGGYDLWSVARNRKDDGGKTGEAKVPRDHLDWVWHMPGDPVAPKPGP